MANTSKNVVLPSLERPVVAAAMAVGIALTSEPSQLSQQVAYSPARGLAPLPGDGIVIAVRAEYVVNHRTRLNLGVKPLRSAISFNRGCRF
jgi:hypothetical protein